jgi:hypothetical protein
VWAVAGAALGAGVSRLRPPLFEASAMVDISVDAARTAPLGEITSQQAFDRVRALLLADETLLEAAGRSGTGIPVRDAAAVRARIRLAQRPDGWELLSYAHDPESAAVFANAWAEVAVERIESALLHALRAAELQQVLYESGCALTAGNDSHPGALWVCTSGEASQLPESLAQEVSQSHGILPIFTYAWTRRASGPDRPVAWTGAGFLLAGSLLGLIGGFTWAALRGTADG